MGGRCFVKITVDGDRCMGHGRCYAEAPELLSYDEEGFVNIRGIVLDVPPDQEEAAKLAIESCPEQAFVVVED
jgi:ferredoxin